MAKPTLPDLAHITALSPLLTRMIPPEYRDENDHMNVRHYMTVFDDAGYPLIESFGLSPSFHAQHGTGGFDLEHHLHYLREVRIGDQVTVTARVLGHSAKRIHYMMFMVNDTRGTLAATFECVNAFADLGARRTAAYPPEIAARIAAVAAAHAALAWAAPVCGVMSA
jgi:acyl-CoA thioester hydrolase